MEPEVAIQQALDAAVYVYRQSDRAVAADLVDEITESRSGASEVQRSWVRNVERVASGWMLTVLREVWERGWQPRDVVEHIRRRTDSGELFVVDAIASEAQRYAPATIDDRWFDQLEDVGAAEVWWSGDQTLVGAWSAQSDGDLGSVLFAAVSIVAQLRTLPPLQRTLPLPGDAMSRGVGGRRHEDVDDKVLARIRALLAKAESTDFPEEAEALSGKAQQLMTKFSLDRALVDAADDSDDDPVTARRIWLDKPYVKAKSMLVSAAARANRCRTVFDQSLGFVSLVGDETDLRLVEVLATSLLVQANRAMLAQGSQRGAWGQSETRSYRQSFLVSYGKRIGERLHDAVNAGRAEVDDEARLLPVLAARDAEVDAAFSKLFPHTQAMKINVSNQAGWRDGRVAADMARLDMNRSVRQ